MFIVTNLIKIIENMFHKSHTAKPQQNTSMKITRALFILRLREDYSSDIENYSHQQVATGMFNSATFVSDMLSSNFSGTTQ